MTELGEFAEGWKPNPGDRVEGKVVELARGYSDFRGDHYPIIVIEQADHTEVAVHCFHTVLENKVKEQKPLPGEYIEILFQGEKPTKDGKRTMKVYAVRVPGRSQEGFWDDGAAPAAAGAAATPTPVPATDVPWDDDDVPF